MHHLSSEDMWGTFGMTKVSVKKPTRNPEMCFVTTLVVSGVTLATGASGIDATTSGSLFGRTRLNFLTSIYENEDFSMYIFRPSLCCVFDYRSIINA